MFRALSLALLVSGCMRDAGNFSVAGTVSMAQPLAAADVPVRTVTHVMAVDPEPASPHRTLAPVDDHGDFKLEVEAGRPYVLFFIDSTAVGADMVVGIFRAGSLDTLSPQLAGHLELGDVKVDAATQTATSGTAYDALLTSLGLSESAAEYLGSIDDLSLRYANPDIDGDGVIDADQGHDYALDMHVRSDVRRGSASGPSFTVDDIVGRFLPESGAEVATPVYNLTSLYVLYPRATDGQSYVNGNALANGAAYSARSADGAELAGPTSYSSLGFGDTVGWGADYDLEHDAALELPGSSGPATISYRLGTSGPTLTFTNVVTRTKAELAASGTLAIFVRLVLDGSGNIASIDYRWEKRAGGAWIPATAEEIDLTIGSDGGYISVHHTPSWSNEFGLQIPADPAGTIRFQGPPTAPDEICGLAVSYDDKLGMRHFVGGVAPNAGVSCSAP